MKRSVTITVNGHTRAFPVDECGYFVGGECQTCGGGFQALVNWLAEAGAVAPEAQGPAK